MSKITIQKYDAPACAEPGCCHECVTNVIIDGIQAGHIRGNHDHEVQVIQAILSHFKIESEIDVKVD